MPPARRIDDVEDCGSGCDDAARVGGRAGTAAPRRAAGTPAARQAHLRTDDRRAAGQPAHPAPRRSARRTERYTYNPEGRRDPFVSLIARGVEAPAGGKAPGSAASARPSLSSRVC